MGLSFLRAPLDRQPVGGGQPGVGLVDQPLPVPLRGVRIARPQFDGGGEGQDRGRERWPPQVCGFAEPGAESFEDIVARVGRVMERLSEVAAERRVVAVSHHNFLHFFLGVVLFGDAFAPWMVPALYHAGHANTGITIFEHVASRVFDGVDLPGWVLTTWNDRAHL